MISRREQIIKNMVNRIAAKWIAFFGAANLLAIIGMFAYVIGFVPTHAMNEAKAIMEKNIESQAEILRQKMEEGRSDVVQLKVDQKVAANQLQNDVKITTERIAKVRDELQELETFIHAASISNNESLLKSIAALNDKSTVKTVIEEINKLKVTAAGLKKTATIQRGEVKLKGLVGSQDNIDFGVKFKTPPLLFTSVTEHSVTGIDMGQWAVSSNPIIRVSTATSKVTQQDFSISFELWPKPVRTPADSFITITWIAIGEAAE